MAKNKIQFQRGLSLARFLTQYGTEEQCRAALFRFRWPQGFRCPECGYAGYCEINRRKVYQCNRCHSQTSVISNTIFAATKLPLKTWFLGIYLITQAKDGMSSLNLARALGVSANAALRIKHKLQQTMKERDDDKPLQNLVLMDDVYWGGCHSIRHTVATKLSKKLSLRELMDTMGWRTAQMALRYDHGDEKSKRDALAELSPF